MRAFLILEEGTVFEGTSIGADKEMISEIVFNTSMTGYLEVLTDPSYAGQAVVMTYPLIGNYGITPDMESKKAWPDGLAASSQTQNSPPLPALTAAPLNIAPCAVPAWQPARPVP